MTVKANSRLAGFTFLFCLALIALLFRVAEGMLSPVSAFTRRALLATATEPAPDRHIAAVLLKTQGFAFLLGSTCFAAGSTIRRCGSRSRSSK